MYANRLKTSQSRLALNESQNIGFHSMSSFLGEHTIVIDSNGRFNVPAKFKAIFEEQYGSNIVICSKKNYLMISPEKEWVKTEEKLLALNNSEDENEKEKIRAVFQNSTYGEIKSGKISLPPKQREKVGIKVKEEAVLIGMATSFEIWSQDEWAKYSG